VTLPLSYTQKARADLDDIYDFIAPDNPLRARTYIEDIETACEGLCDTPMLGVARPDLRPNLRILTPGGSLAVRLSGHTRRFL
jgi:toxin ParE1/3/4